MGSGDLRQTGSGDIARADRRSPALREDRSCWPALPRWRCWPRRRMAQQAAPRPTGTRTAGRPGQPDTGAEQAAKDRRDHAARPHHRGQPHRRDVDRNAWPRSARSTRSSSSGAWRRRRSDIFFGVPGVAVQSDAKRAATSVNIRGLQDFGRVAVIVDGARQNFQRSGHGTQSLFWIDPELIQQVDVIRGPGRQHLRLRRDRRRGLLRDQGRQRFPACRARPGRPRPPAATTPTARAGRPARPAPTGSTTRSTCSATSSGATTATTRTVTATRSAAPASTC